MKVIIVDDEPKAIALIKSYLTHFSQLELIGSFRNGLKAFEFISNQKVDLIFLDINMPHINGISLSKMIGGETKVIFTTAYSEYAVESYEVDAMDYLLKPISLERFTKAVSKVITDKKSSLKDTDLNKIVLIKSGSVIHRVKVNHIKYIQKDGNYAIYHLGNQKIIARQSIAQTLENLPSNFIRVHKSYIINKNKVSAIGKDVLNINSKDIPIGASYKQQTMEHFLNI